AARPARRPDLRRDARCRARGDAAPGRGRGRSSVRVRGPARCPLCAAQAEVLAGLNRRYGVEVLAISADGAAMPGFPAARTDTGQLAAMGIADLPRPLIALVNPAPTASS
ncbi:MAG: conjugal transfer protein TraF, partial [Rhodobacteraceae bacterium]|nr:conjugal transfer protein TraF [Paracoccaceae bacterium]